MFHPNLQDATRAADQRLALSEADHRIANSLAVISALIGLRATAVLKAKAPLDADAVARELQDAGGEIDVVARLHHLLSRNSDESLINVCAYLGESGRNLRRADKYPHPSGVAGEVRLTCGAGEDNTAHITIADDGMGFRLIRALCDQLGAHHSHASDPLGTTFTLDVPL